MYIYIYIYIHIYVYVYVYIYIYIHTYTVPGCPRRARRRPRGARARGAGSGAQRVNVSICMKHRVTHEGINTYELIHLKARDLQCACVWPGSAGKDDHILSPHTRRPALRQTRTTIRNHTSRGFRKALLLARHFLKMSGCVFHTLSVNCNMP